jgi:hypothetical protein
VPIGVDNGLVKARKYFFFEKKKQKTFDYVFGVLTAR